VHSTSYTSSFGTPKPQARINEPLLTRFRQKSRWREHLVSNTHDDNNSGFGFHHVGVKGEHNKTLKYWTLTHEKGTTDCCGEWWYFDILSSPAKLQHSLLVYVCRLVAETQNCFGFHHLRAETLNKICQAHKLPTLQKHDRPRQMVICLHPFIPCENATTLRLFEEVV